MKILILLIFTSVLAGCGIPPSPQVSLHSSGVASYVDPAGIMRFSAGQGVSPLQAEAQKSQAFFGR